ncbi:hypothetical protein D3C87_1649910 [compost metagenome]
MVMLGRNRVTRVAPLITPSPFRSTPAADELPISCGSVSLIVWVPPPWARVYWNDGSIVSFSVSLRVKRDWPRMLPVFDGLIAVACERIVL